MQLVGERFSEVVHSERSDDFIRWQLPDEALCNETWDWEATRRQSRCRRNEWYVMTHDKRGDSSQTYLVSDAIGTAEFPWRVLTNDTLVQPARLQDAWFPPRRVRPRQYPTLRLCRAARRDFPLPPRLLRLLLLVPRLVSNRSWDPRRLSAAQLLQSALASSHCWKRAPAGLCKIVRVYDTFILPSLPPQTPLKKKK